MLAANLPGSEPAVEVALLKPAEEQKGVSQVEKLETAEHADSSVPRTGIPLIWPWGETQLYIAGSIIALLLLKRASAMSDYIIRGFGKEVPPHGAITVIIILFVFLFYAFLLYLLFLLGRWVFRTMRRYEVVKKEDISKI
ncbi:MAG: hypothetical protein WBJ10_07660 [Daejeonella sp.]|uniref:hypothetical protein n=1 Tax=Daejeonella sp. TaxID=2805397 RepID=UPI003C749982